MSTSMMYTIGTALSRAADGGLPVAVLVEGHWIEGQVAGNDGTGVVLEGSDGSHLVVRTERISAVKVLTASPFVDVPDGVDDDLLGEPVTVPNHQHV